MAHHRRSSVTFSYLHLRRGNSEVTHAVGNLLGVAVHVALRYAG